MKVFARLESSSKYFYWCTNSKTKVKCDKKKFKKKKFQESRFKILT